MNIMGLHWNCVSRRDFLVIEDLRVVLHLAHGHEFVYYAGDVVYNAIGVSRVDRSLQRILQDLTR